MRVGTLRMESEMGKKTENEPSSGMIYWDLGTKTLLLYA